MNINLTAEQLREVLKYNPKTGVFVWLKGHRKGKEAGNIVPSHGARHITINQTIYKAHRLAWLYVHGEWPESTIDHKDGDPSNNRLKNLRAATISQNGQNVKLSSRNTSGFKGVSFDKRSKKWRAFIKLPAGNRLLGTFDDPAHASAAYRGAAIATFGQFACLDRT